MYSNNKTILLYGKKGVGKSSLGNILLGEDIFEVSDGIDSCTNQTIKEESSYVPGLNVIDTPGFDDNNMGDEENFYKMLKQLSNERIDFILFVVNFTETRFDPNYRKLVKLLCNMFPKKLTYNLGIVFTHYDDKKERKNYKGKGDPRYSKYKTYVPAIMGLIQKETKEDINFNPPIYFVDNIENDRNTQDQINLLLKLLSTLTPIEYLNKDCNYKYKSKIEIHRVEISEANEGNRVVIVKSVYVKYLYIDYYGNKTFSKESKLYEYKQYKENALEPLNEKNIDSEWLKTIGLLFHVMQGKMLVDDYEKENNVKFSTGQKFLNIIGGTFYSGLHNKFNQ